MWSSLFFHFHLTHTPHTRPTLTPGWKIYGFNRGMHEGKKGIWYREWAPNAKALALVGEFNNWTPKDGHWAIKNEYGVWNLFLPDTPDGKSAIPHK
jgi:1,4-alpha-glucan branching enzyme